MSHDFNPFRFQLTTAQAAELEYLVGRVIDHEPTEAERARLNEILAGDKAIRSHYLRCILLHSMLVTTAGSLARHEAEELKRRLTSLIVASAKTLEKLAPASSTAASRASSFLRISAFPAISATILIALLPALYYLSTQSWYAANQTENGLAATRPSAEQAEEPVGGNVARISYVSQMARWLHPNDSFAVDSSVRAGNKLYLAQGEIELLYDSGAKLLLYGPAEFLVGNIGGELRRGGLMASVPEAGHGFTIVTPHGKIIDLGTEFGVVVDDFGVSEVSVFEGKVEAFPAGLADSQTKKIELTKGRALQWNSETLVSMDADRRRFASSMLLTSAISSAAKVNAAFLDHNFREVPVSSEQWTTLGDVQSSPQGLIMNGQLGKSRQPYLLSTAEYDPTQGGPITVVCDIRFPQLQEGDEPSFAILTRSADKRSDIDAPWNDILGTCLRCNFRSDENSLGGTLETSTKYEPDRELTKMSWRGFQRPQSDVKYRLVMRDDGVNVSFTVSPADNPSVNKTVTCRSLFRGYQHHIALEGWNKGETVVDRVQIYQDPPLDSLTSLSSRDRSARSSNTPNESPENALSGLVPNDSRLILEDHFEGTELDAEQWDALGEVVLRNGQVSLGKPIAAVHINTWNPRPYLLTRRQFTPNNEKLTILGRIEFAENYLQGYGGSFAVMTRSDRRRGDGPGWEYSVLRTGVRSNFWPAAPGHDHNLEIHEKPTPNTISLLAGTGLEINPQARAYYFCVEDDGQAAKITVQDVHNPSIQQTLVHPTSSASQGTGYIGFESCWGSPVLLDDVQIYVSPSEPKAGE